MNTSREVTIYQQIDDPVSAAQSIGAWIAKSQIFGCQNEAQGQVLALECMAKQMSPLSLAEKYDIIQGKLSMKADAMLAGFEDAGGKYEVKEYSTNACEIIFIRGNNKLPIRISWEDAQQESWPYAKDGTTLKHNWATPIGKQDMLWARVVSRGVRRLAAGVVCGRYTPEEIVDFDSGPSGTPAIEQTGVVDAEFTVEKSATPTQPLVEQKVLHDPANETNGPVSESAVDQIKIAFESAFQTGTVEKGTGEKLRSKLKDSGLKTLSDLTATEANVLLVSIQNKTIDAWFETTIVGHAKSEQPAENESGNATGG